MGALHNSSCTDNNGQKHFRTDVIADEVYFVDSRGESGASASTTTTTNAPAPNFEEISTDGDLPF